MESTYSFGYWLRRRRKALDLTQEQLADRAGCVVTTIKKIEGDTRRPSRQLAEILADVLAIPAEERAAFLKAARGEQIADALAVAAQPIASATPTAEMPLPSGTVTFLFTDIEGSTQLWEHYPEAMRAALARHDTILRQSIEMHAGVVFKTVGDAFHTAFVTAADALTAALAAQRALAAEAWDATGPLRVRMALHTGTAELRDGDYFGATLNRTARLMAAGHGGQVLLSLAAAELVREQLPPCAELRDLGLHRLKDLSLPEQIFQLLIPDQPSEFPPLQTLNPRRTNLPVPLTALIGREHEVAGVSALLRQAKVRLVTLTGPGGIGKTRLSLQIAAELSGEFADGVYFVDLAPIRDASLVAATIAHTLGLRESGAQPLFEQLKDYLRAKQMLLLLDNFEQVLEGGSVVAELLAAASQLKVLVSSRERLHLRGEKEVSVQPLGLPDPAHLPVLEQLSQYTAVELFIERAIDARTDFEVTNANAPAVAEICARLDGLPLAIELAAARLKLFSVEALLARLSSRLALLSGGQRDLPVRQQTIRSTIAWSYDLLTEAEQTLFRRLGVFMGGCTLEAAEAIGNAAGDLLFEAVEGVAALVDKSLLRQTEGMDGEPRFVMLETVREYALERLEQSGELEPTRQRHAEHFLALAEAAESELRGPHQLVYLKLLEAENDNLRAALGWGLAQTAAEISVRLAAALWWFWLFRAHFSEGRGWLAQLLAREEANPLIDRRGAPLAKALAGAGLLAFYHGDNALIQALGEQSLAIASASGSDESRALALLCLSMAAETQNDFVAANKLGQESLALFRAAGDVWGQAFALLWLGGWAADQGESARAHLLCQDSLSIFRTLGNPWGQAAALYGVSMIAHHQSDYERAAVYARESLSLARTLGDHHGQIGALSHLAYLAGLRDHYAQAEAYFAESQALSQELGSNELLAWQLYHSAVLAQRQGDYEQASRRLKESLRMFQEQNDQFGTLLGVAACVETVAEAIGPEGSPGRVVRLFAVASALRETVGTPPFPEERIAYDRALGAARAQLDDATFIGAWAEGQVMSLEQAIAEALEGDQ